MIFAKMAQREAVQVPAMGRIAKRAEIGVVGRHDDQSPARSEQPVEILHRPHDARDVLDHMRTADFVERAVGKGQGRLIEICDNIRAARRMRVYAD
jgi:hypothetical protein